MKLSLLSTILILILSCSGQSISKKPTVTTNRPIQRFDWLLGNWERIDDQKGKQTYETWVKNLEGEYIGLGYTLAEQDTVFKENLRLLKIKDIWNLEVTGVNPESTYFQFTVHTPNSFVCENEKNEFPKKIHYTLNGEMLEATISAGETVMLFTFKRRS